MNPSITPTGATPQQTPSSSVPSESVPIASLQVAPNAQTLWGMPVVPGVAWAPAAWTRRPQLPPAHAPQLNPALREAAIQDFQQATNTVEVGLLQRAEHASDHAAELLIVTASIVQDRAWKNLVIQTIREGTPAVQATMAATQSFIERFEKAGGAMEERITDLRDVRDRVIAHLQGLPEPGIPVVDHPVVLLADDLSPADTAGLDPANYVAIATEMGGPTSHTSIIARQLGIPCIVAARRISTIQPGEPVLVDAYAGSLRTGISEQAAEQLLRKDRARRERVRSWNGPGRTRDGHHVRLAANVQNQATALAAAKSAADGIGLFRTEMMFLNSETEPTIQQQADAFRPVFEAFPGSAVVIRTLDAGSDKPVPFASMIQEFNPSLGVRGIRTTGHNPDVLLHQLDAIALAAQNLPPDTDVRIMAPMVSTIPEAEWFAGLVHERGLMAGIMIEVPSVAILIDQFLPYADFFSIGTNDLAQYTMASDRMSPDLAEYTDPWQPAVLALMSKVCAAGAGVHKPISVCGEAASDPLLACVLTGMGVTSLSMAAGAIPGVGAQLADVTFEQCQRAAHDVLGSKNPGEARYRAQKALGIAVLD